MMRSEVERQLEIVGEALNIASRDDSTLRERLPDLRRIVGLRNRVIHGYDAVDDEIVWDIVRIKLPELESQVAELFEPE